VTVTTRFPLGLLFPGRAVSRWSNPVWFIRARRTPCHVGTATRKRSTPCTARGRRR
jgi:hypothetical protein